MTAAISSVYQQMAVEFPATDRFDTLVLLRSRDLSRLQVRGRLRQLSERLRAIEDKTLREQAGQERWLESINSRSLDGKSVKMERIGTPAIPVAAASLTLGEIHELADDSEVVAIFPNQPVRPIRGRSGTIVGNPTKAPWGISSLGVEGMWGTTEGEDIKVGVLDTGVYAEHESLAGRLSSFVLVDPLGRTIQADPFDSDSHGTHVCGIIAGGSASGIGIGVAPRATLVVAAALLGSPTLKTLIASLSWAVSSGADIVNMSLGFTYYEPLFATLLQDMVSLFNVLPVVAIGNENHGNTSCPGNVPSAIGVGAVEVGSTGSLEVSRFSSGASLVFPGSQNALVTKPDLVAPGVGILSCVPPSHDNGFQLYREMDGTSMAAPHVAGCAALLMSAEPTSSAQQIAEVLRETARHPKGSDGRPDNRWGFGVIRPVEALAALRS